MSPEERLQRARELSKTGDELAPTDLDGAVSAYLDSRLHLVSIGFMEAAAAVLMDAVAAARRHENRELAMNLCRRAARDDPRWDGPMATLALLETEVGNALVEQDQVAKALLFYGRAMRHHRRAAELLERTDPEGASIERKFEGFVRERRKGVIAWAKRRGGAGAS